VWDLIRVARGDKQLEDYMADGKERQEVMFFDAITDRT